MKEGKASAPGKKERTSHRSKSWDPHRAKVIAADGGVHAGKSPTSEDRYNCVLERNFTADIRLNRELPLDYGSGYPQSSTLRIDDKIRHQRDVAGKESWEAEEGKNCRFKESEYSSTQDQSQTEDDGVPNVSQYSNINDILPTHPYEPVINHSYEPALPWPKPSLQRMHSLRVSNPQREDIQRPGELASHQPACEATASHDQQEIRSAAVSNREQRIQGERPELITDSTVTDADGFIEDDYRLYQRAEGLEEDACSSLCLNEDEIIDAANAYRRQVADYHHLLYNNCEPDLQYQGQQSHYYNASIHQTHVASLQNSRDSPFKGLIPPVVQNEVSRSPTRPAETTWRLRHQGAKSPGAQGDSSPRPGPLSQGEPKHDQDLNCPDGSIFDYCHTSEMESDAETVRKSADEGDGESAHWAAEVEEAREEEESTGLPQPHRPLPSAARGETGENQSITGDSGIDSPR